MHFLVLARAVAGAEGEGGEFVTAIHFQQKKLIQIARQIEGDSAQLTLADAASPTIMRTVDDTSVLYVLMPMRV